MNTRVQARAKIEEALETISSGLAVLEQADLDGVFSRPSRRMVDVTAKLNAQSLAIEKMLKPLKDSIKADALSQRFNGDTVIIKGGFSQAIVKRCVKSYLEVERIKIFLGKLLPTYTRTQTEYQISFQVKE